MPMFDNREEEELVRIGPGTPSGEVFRRYWLPIEVSAKLGRYAPGGAGPSNPIRVKMLGEDLILYRDASGHPGLLAEHCSHRGTSLFYGRVEENCVRCLYHGWAYDREGNVIDTPGEPPDSNFKHTVKHQSYPCVEVAGLIFTYMGPPEKQPLFPKYEILFREDGVRTTGNANYVEQCNVFQAMHDNNLDPWHGEILHSWFKRLDGVPSRDSYLHHGEDSEEASPIKFERTPWGTRYVDVKKTNVPGKYEYHETHTVWPCQRYKRSDVKWAVPIDDYRTRWFEVAFHPFGPDGQLPRRARAGLGRSDNLSFGNGPAGLPIDWAQQVGAWWNLGHPWRQGVTWEDEVAQSTQGSPERHYLPDWEQWHLATSDRGLMLNRTVWREQVDRVKEGMDPIHIIRDARDDVIIRIPGDNVKVTYQQALRWFSMSAQDRLNEVLELERAGSRPASRGF